MHERLNYNWDYLITRMIKRSMTKKNAYANCPYQKKKLTLSKWLVLHLTGLCKTAIQSTIPTGTREYLLECVFWNNSRTWTLYALHLSGRNLQHLYQIQNCSIRHSNNDLESFSYLTKSIANAIYCNSR